MNKSYSSSSQTPPPPLPFRPTSVATTATRLTPAVIPLEYNYNIMSPSSYTNTHSRPRTAHRDSGNLESFHYSSIFGDPVPTAHPVEFLGADNENGLFRPHLLQDISSEEDSRRRSGIFPTLRNFEILSGSSIPRLKPPDIQVLPNSSGDSGSEALGSPNYSLLRPVDIQTTSALYENITPVDVNEILETVTISDAAGVREYSEAKRRVSNVSEDFRSNVGTTCHKDAPCSTNAKLTTRCGSNESYSSEDWFRPATRDFPEFSKMPKMRPSSKNVMLIKNSEMPSQFSPVAAMFNDSSSGDEHLAELPKIINDTTPDRPPVPSETTLKHLEDPAVFTTYFKSYPLAEPPPLPPPPTVALKNSESVESIASLKSPAIKTNLIATGGDHRVATPRLHKKTSFTILPDKSPHSSRAATPSEFSHRYQSPSAKPIAKPRYHLPPKSLSSTQLKLPHITHMNQFTSDDSPRPSVQFDMTGRYSPIKVPAKGILQHRESLSSSQDALPQTRKRFPSTLPDYGHKHRSYEALPIITDPYRTAIPRLNRSAFDINLEPAIFPPGALPRPLRPNPNPTRKHKGLLRIINRDDMLSRSPLRSEWTSMDDLVLKRRGKPLMQRRRSSSTSPERRSSTLTGSDRRSSNLSSITTSDFSFRRPSLTNSNNFKRRNSMVKPPITPKRRQSVIANNLPSFGKNTTRTKISKPTTLSPIIGTPNKDSSTPQSPVRMMLPTGPTSESFSDTSRRDSLSKIPVRRGSQSSSRVVSRAGSPSKESTLLLPTSGRTSQATSYRSPSRGSLKFDSPKLQSRSPSRSNSRASTRAISQAQSRSSSRQSEQVKYMASSRSTSRASIKSTPRTSHTSLSPQRRYAASSMGNRKSTSLSPQIKPRETSSSPTKSRLYSRNASQTRNREKSASKRNSRSRIPRRASVTSGSSKSPPKSRVPVLRSKKDSPNKGKTNKKPIEAASAKKVTSAAKKTESSVKRKPSAVVKQKPGTKKEPNVTKKTEKDINKDTVSTVKKPAVKNAQTTTNLKKATAPKTENEKKKSGKSLSKTPSTKSLNTKTATETASKKTKDNAKMLAGDEIKAIGANAGKLGAIGTVAAGTAVAAAIASSTSEDNTESEGGSGASMKRTPTQMSLMRMGSRISLFGKKRPDSSLSKRITEEELSDSMSQGQGTNPPLTPDAAAILERSQKTLEDVQKTVAVATDEIQKTIKTNLTDLKTLEIDAGKALTAMVEEGVSPASSAATVVENTLSTQNVDVATTSASPMPNGQPIEAEVSVINQQPKKNGASERVSARAISVLPEVESESANLQNFELDVTDKSKAALAAAGVAGPLGEPQSDDFKEDAKRRSPDGQGGSTAGSGEK